MSSWKTTTLGASALLIIIGNVLHQLLDGDPATNPDWNMVIPTFIAATVGLFAKDHNVSNSPTPGPATIVPKQ